MSEPLSTKNRDTSVPLIQKGHYCRWKLTGITPGVTDNGPTVKLKWELQEDAPSNRLDTNGMPVIITPGSFPGIYFDTIFCYSKNGGRQQPDHFVDTLCKRVDALLGTDKEGNPYNKPTRPEVFADGATLQDRGEYKVLDGTLNPELIGMMIGKEMIASMNITKDSRDNSDRQEFGKLYFLEDYKG